MKFAEGLSNVSYESYLVRTLVRTCLRSTSKLKSIFLGAFLSQFF